MATSRIEVVTSTERRRRYTETEKLRYVAETHAEGSSVAAVARKHGLREGLLFGWRRAVRDGRLGHRRGLATMEAPPSTTTAVSTAPPESAFIRVHPSTPEPASFALQAGTIRIGLPDGVMIDLPTSMDPMRIAALVRAIGARC